MQTKKRPVFLDLQVLVRHLPVPGIVSILHRASGVILFIMIPVLLMLLNGSLSSGEDFESYKAVADNPLVKLILIGVLLKPHRLTDPLILYLSFISSIVFKINSIDSSACGTFINFSLSNKSISYQLKPPFGVV